MCDLPRGMPDLNRRIESAEQLCRMVKRGGIIQTIDDCATDQIAVKSQHIERVVSHGVGNAMPGRWFRGPARWRPFLSRRSSFAPRATIDRLRSGKLWNLPTDQIAVMDLFVRRFHFPSVSVPTNAAAGQPDIAGTPR